MAETVVDKKMSKRTKHARMLEHNSIGFEKDNAEFPLRLNSLINREANEEMRDTQTHGKSKKTELLSCLICACTSLV